MDLTRLLRLSIKEQASDLHHSKKKFSQPARGPSWHSKFQSSLTFDGVWFLTGGSYSDPHEKSWGWSYSRPWNNDRHPGGSKSCKKRQKCPELFCYSDKQLVTDVNLRSVS